MFDREDYEQSSQIDRLDRQRHSLQQIAQAEVASNLLTQDPHWNTFLQILQSWKDVLDGERQALAQKMETDRYQGTDALLALKIDAQSRRAESDLLGQIMAIPKRLQETGETAREVLSSLGVQDADDASH